MRYFQRLTRSNTLVGIFLLLMLATFAAPSIAPALIARYVPFIDEGLPCGSARVADTRSRHQSLIGRAAAQQGIPFEVRVAVEAIPLDSSGSLVVQITLINRSVGTVPFVYPGDILINNTTLNGVGVTFNNAPVTAVTAQQGLIPDSNIRLLAPRQRCVMYATIPAVNFAQFGINQNSFVKGFYRNSSSGVGAGTVPGQTAIFPDQGLWVGVVESNPIPIISVSQ